MQPLTQMKLLTYSQIDNIFQIFAHENPTPKTELKYNNHFQLLIAVVMSAQATDISVNKATDTLFQFIQTPEDILILGEEKLKQYIKSIGLYHAKAKNIIKLSEMLVNQLNSIVPDNYEALIKLPGVGHKTAKVILNCLFNVPIIAVDTHIFRVAQRLGIAYAPTAEKLEHELLKAIPSQYHHHAHHWLILHGRYICKAQKPKCTECKLAHLCVFYKVNN